MDGSDDATEPCKMQTLPIVDKDLPAFQAVTKYRSSHYSQPGDGLESSIVKGMKRPFWMLRGISLNSESHTLYSVDLGYSTEPRPSHWERL